MAVRLRLTTLVVVSTFALVGCGGGSDIKDDVSDLSSTALLAKAKKAVAAEESVTIEGKGAEEGTEIEIDMSYAGDTASGTIAVDGSEFQLLGAGGKAYFKAADDFYREGAGEDAEQIITLIDGRWVLADPANPDFADLASFVEKDDFFGELLKPDGDVTKGKGKTIDGVECVSLVDDSNGTFYFAKDGGRPISLISTGDDGGTLTFSYDEVEEVKAPTADEIVDLAELG